MVSVRCDLYRIVAIGYLRRRMQLPESVPPLLDSI